MSKVFTGEHKAFGLVGVGTSAQDAADKIGFPIDELIITEMEKTDYLLRDVPEEFKSRLSYMAYEDGHAYGQDEIESKLSDLVSDLLPCIKDFEKRLTTT
jgi:hypothetical protein